MSTIDFYKNIEPMSDMYNLIRSDKFVPVPEDWDVIVTDIYKSTQAIEQGRYKDVNFIAASTIIAILNALPDVDIPFVFGGDGATLLIPNSFRGKISEVLVDICDIVQKRFELKLRAGLVPIKTLYEKNAEVKIAKHSISENYEQAIFKGGGLSVAEDLVKNGNGEFEINVPLNEGCADFTGLECRWEDIYSFKGESMSLIVKMVDERNGADNYEIVLKEIDHLYGPAGKRNPIGEEDIKLSFKKRGPDFESRILGKSKLLHTIKVWLSNLYANYLFKFGNEEWLRYKQLIKSTCDYEKFDDTLKVVLSGSPYQREQLLKILDKFEQNKKIVYGVLITNRTLMTCLIFERHGRQIHFIDAADGGYALAAKQLKEKWNKMIS